MNDVEKLQELLKKNSDGELRPDEKAEYDRLMEKFGRVNNAQKVEKKKEGEKVAVGCLVFFGIAAVLVWLMWPSDNRTPAEKQRQAAENAERSLQAGARVSCQEFVKRQLRSPSTAKFPFTEQRISRLRRNVYRVSGPVDAQNAFGATIRNRYICEVEKSASQWKLLDIQVLE